MSRVDLSGFKPVAFEHGKIHMRGGALAKPAPIDSRVITLTENRKVAFVKMATREQWLVAAATGERKLTRLFERTTLLNDLRLKILQYCSGAMDSSSDDNTQESEYDPMSELVVEAADPSCPPVAVRGMKRMHYKRNAALKTCVCFDMPLRCPEEDPGCTETKKIMLYIEDRKQIWLALDDVSWAIQYLYVQAHLKGVPLIDDHCLGPRSVR